MSLKYFKFKSVCMFLILGFILQSCTAKKPCVIGGDKSTQEKTLIVRTT